MALTPLPLLVASVEGDSFPEHAVKQTTGLHCFKLSWWCSGFTPLKFGSCLVFGVMLKLLYSKKVAAGKNFLISWVRASRSEAGAMINAGYLRLLIR